jgi:hypothetical protein
VLEGWHGVPDVTRWRASVAVTALVLLSACGLMSPAGSAAPAGPAVAVVTLGIYSGRPDPSWTLTSAEALTLSNMFAGLANVTGTPPVGGLGYHGYTITMPTSTLIAYRGAISAPGEGSRAVMSDPTRSIERFLLETSRGHVTPDEFATAQLAIGAP